MLCAIDVRAWTRVATVALSVIAPSIAYAGTPAAEGPSPQKIAAQRQEILADMLTDKYDAGVMAGLRRVCATGRAPASVAEDRGEGAYFTPDASDECVTALLRTAHDRRLPELYAKLLAELGGNPDGAEQLPRLVGAAVLNGDGKAAIGNGKVALVKPALAFDAGFAVGYQDGPSAKTPRPDPAQLKSLAEACLAQGQDAGACFSAGYVYGVQGAVRHAAAR